jgi:hypothetical protein
MAKFQRSHVAGLLTLAVVVGVVGILSWLRLDPGRAPSGPASTLGADPEEPANPLDDPEAEGPTGPAVEVLVLTASNVPAANADLRVWTVRDQGLRYPAELQVPHDRRRTNDHGRARVPLDPDREGDYVFAATHGTEEGERRAAVEPGQDSPVVIWLAPGTPCTVFVLDEDGEPAADCRVGWHVGLVSGKPSSEGRTDSSGCFRFVRRPGPTYSVVAFHGEGTAAVRASVAPSTPSVTLRLEDLGVIRGRVLGDQDAPLHAVRVRLLASVSRPNWFESLDSEGTTDREGRFELPASRRSRHMSILAEAPGHQRGKKIIRTEPGNLPTEDVVLRLEPSSSLKVRVVGIPEESRGTLTTVRLEHMIPRGTGMSVTGASDTFDFPDVPDGEFMVVATTPGAVLAGLRRVKIESAAQRSQAIEVELVRAASYAGTLLGPSGEPAGGLVVRLSVEERDVAETRSDDDGRFEMECLPAELDAGAIWIYPPFARQVLWRGPSTRFRASDATVLTLPGLRRLSGVLRWEDGGAVSRGRVSVLWAAALLRSLHSYLQYHPVVVTDADGRFELWVDVSAGGRVAALAPGAIPSLAELEDVLDSGEILLRRGGILAGRVLSEAGGPVPEATVTVMATGRHAGDITFLATSVTTREGTFEFHGLDPETPYSLDVLAPGYQAGRAVVDTTTPTPVVIRVASASGIEGVVQFADGSPCRSGRVAAIPAQGQTTRRTGRIGVEGRFRIDGLASGAYRLRPEPIPRQEVGHGGVAFWPKVDVRWTSPGEPCILTVEKPGYVHGVVSDANGAPVADATVRMVPSGSSGGFSRRRILLRCRCRTDPSGRYRIGMPARGPVQIEVSARGFLTERISAETTSRRDVVLKPAAKLTGTTLDRSDRPVGNVVLVVVASSGGPRARRVVRSDARGKFSVDCDPTEEYSVYAGDPWSSDTVTTAVPAQLKITVHRPGE